MKKAILATTVGMTQIFDEDGVLIPVTVLQAGPCVVTQVKTEENDGYKAVQVGFVDKRDKLVNKPQKGHFDKAGVSYKRYVREFRFENAEEYNVKDEIKADNAARQEWNRTADMALLSGISEAKILEVKQTEIHEKASQSIKSKGWLPNLFRGIVAKAKDFLQNLIREKDMPPKPTLDIDMAEFRHMRNLMIKVQDKAKEIKNLQDKVLPQLKQQLADTKGLFKGKERKALEVKIKETEVEIADRLDKIPDTLKADGYPDVQVFMRTFREMESVVEQYNRDLAEWEYQVSRKPTAATKEQHRPPERQSVLKHLREIQERNKQQPPQRQHKKSIDRDSR